MTTASTPKIIVGIDGSPSSIDALRWAAALTETSGHRIDAVMAWEPTPSYEAAVGYGDPQPAATAARKLASALAKVYGSDIPDDVLPVVRQGNPTQVLLNASRDAAMLVVGSRGHNIVSQLLLGSVSAYCAEHASCPVVIVR